MNEPTSQLAQTGDIEIQDMSRSPNIGELATALAKAQGAMFAAEKSAKNPFLNSSYADLASVWAVCREPLSVNGLAIVQLPGGTGAGRYIETLLMHSSGQWISSLLRMSPGYTPKGGKFTHSDDPQSIGSSITYARRYGLMAMVGIATADDDAEDATRGMRKLSDAAEKLSSRADIEKRIDALLKIQEDTQDENERLSAHREALALEKDLMRIAESEHVPEWQGGASTAKGGALDNPDHSEAACPPMTETSSDGTRAEIVPPGTGRRETLKAEKGPGAPGWREIVVHVWTTPALKDKTLGEVFDTGSLKRALSLMESLGKNFMAKADGMIGNGVVLQPNDQRLYDGIKLANARLAERVDEESK